MLSDDGVKIGGRIGSSVRRVAGGHCQALQWVRVV